MTDLFFMEKIADMISCRKVQRLLYRKGMTFEGTFIPYMSMSCYTSSNIFNCPENETQVMIRLAKLTGKEGVSDTSRDVIGMFTKFYHDAGVFDMVAHSIKLPDELRSPEFVMKLIEVLKEQNGILIRKGIDDHELMKFALIYYTDRTTVKSFRNIEGYVLNEYEFVNDEGRRFNVNLRWVPVLGVKCITRSEAEFLSGYDPDIAFFDIITAISEGKYPEYELEAEIEGSGIIKIGKLRLLTTLPERIDDNVQFDLYNLDDGIELKDTAFNRFTAFAFSESRRKRGGTA